jgi:cytochrome c-type biogenesis protein CcmH
VRHVAAALAALLLAAAALPGAAAAADCPRTNLPDIEDEVMCLQCGVPLAVAEEAPSAKRQRVYIQREIDKCKSKQQIKDQLVAQFGDRILAEPEGSGAWLVPVLGFSLGALAIGLAAWRWRSTRRGPPSAGEPTAATAAGAPLDPDDAARLKADIDRYDL